MYAVEREQATFTPTSYDLEEPNGAKKFSTGVKTFEAIVEGTPYHL